MTTPGATIGGVGGRDWRVKFVDRAPFVVACVMLAALLRALSQQPGCAVVTDGQVFLGAGPGIDHLVAGYFDFC